MGDHRNWCGKFLSNECPNNCHYDTWCKHREELLKMVSVTQKIGKRVSCPECGSTRISGLGFVKTRASIIVNTGEVEDIEFDCDTKPTGDYEKLFCDSCDHEWNGTK